VSTWLDHYIDGAAAQLHRAGLSHRAIASDIDAMRLMALSATQSPRPPDQQAGLSSMMATILPWLLPPEALSETADRILGQPVAYQLTPDLLAALVQGDAPDAPELTSFLDAHNLFLDLPGRGLPLSDQQSIRALFVQPMTAPGQWHFVAILTNGRSNEMTGRHVWSAGSDGQPLEAYGLDIEEVPDATVAKVVWRIIRLAVLYALSTSESSPAPPEPLPRTEDAILCALKDKKRRARRKTHTVFSVHRLSRRASSSLPSADIGAWTLDHVVEVRGHFRWQAHGPQRRLRKLIWIDAHERGSGSKRHDITRLEGE
jgi:hypothetical protein